MYYCVNFGQVSSSVRLKPPLLVTRLARARKSLLLALGQISAVLLVDDTKVVGYKFRNLLGPLALELLLQSYLGAHIGSNDVMLLVHNPLDRKYLALASEAARSCPPQ